MANLTPKQQRFVEEYLIDLNGTQAALRAGYAESGAAVEASRLLRNAKVVEELNKGRQKLSERLEISQERILQEYARIGFSDLRNVLDEDGKLKSPKDWDDDMAGAIASLEVNVVVGSDDAGVHTHKIKTWDKPKALDAMAKHLGMFEGKKDVDDPEESEADRDARELGRKLAFVLSGALGGQ